MFDIGIRDGGSGRGRGAIAVTEFLIRMGVVMEADVDTVDFMGTDERSGLLLTILILMLCECGAAIGRSTYGYGLGNVEQPIREGESVPTRRRDS